MTTARAIFDHPAFAPHALPVPRKSVDARGEPSLGELLFMPLAQLATVSIGYRNLLCATALPDTADLDLIACRRTLEDWTRRVLSETDRCLHQFRRDPGQYENSEAYYRVMMMVTVLQLDCGVTYNPEAIETTEFKTSRDGFLHGLLTGDMAGTCANMPVLYAAVGRRLGYPIYLVQAKGHLFCRWHDATTGERFNIEASNRGLSVLPDSYYLTWPKPITDAENYHGIYLRNLDPNEELGFFMATRGHCLQDAGHLLDAIVAYGHAHRLAPTDPNIMGFLMAAVNHELDLHKAGKLPATYRQAEGWDKTVAVQRFILNSRYRERTAGVNTIDQGTAGPGRLAR